MEIESPARRKRFSMQAVGRGGRADAGIVRRKGPDADMRVEDGRV